MLIQVARTEIVAAFEPNDRLDQFGRQEAVAGLEARRTGFGKCRGVNDKLVFRVEALDAGNIVAGEAQFTIGGVLKHENAVTAAEAPHQVHELPAASRGES